MNTNRVLILNKDEALDLLAGWFAQTLANDVVAVKESLITGQAMVPRDLHTWTAGQIAEQVGELNLAEALAKEHQVEKVFVFTGEPSIYDCVWDLENLEPARRSEFVGCVDRVLVAGTLMSQHEIDVVLGRQE